MIYGTFNASIPSKSIPSDTFEWRASETESEPISTENNNNDDDESNEDDDEDEEGQQTSTSTKFEERNPSQYGEWVNKITGVAIGGDDGTVEFNVVE